MSIYLKALTIMILLLASNSSTWNCRTFDKITETCKECFSGTYLVYGICHLKCPDGFQVISNFSCEPERNPLSIQAAFYLYKSLKAQQVDAFVSEKMPLTGYSRNFVPTVDRGLFAHKTSALRSKEMHSLAPSFTFQIYFKPETNGVIFSYNTVFTVFISESVVYFHIRVINQISFHEEIRIASVICDLNAWNNLNIYFSQKTGSFISLSIKNSWSKILTDQIFMDLEKFEDVKREAEYYYIGDFNHADTASGFYYELMITNCLILTSIESYNLNICNYSSFWDGNSCQACMSSCELPCVRGTDCNTCMSSNCIECDGYGPNDCLSCDNGELAPFCCDFGCSLCDSLSKCFQCNPGFYLTWDYCVFELPTAYQGSIESMISVLAMDFTSGDFGELNNYFSLNSRMPVHVKGRGIYFDGNSYLVSKSKIVLAIEFSIRILFKSNQLGVFPLIYLKDSICVFSSENVLKIVLVDYKGDFKEVYVSGTVNEAIWSYFTITVTPNKQSSIISFFQNTLQIISQSFPGLLRMQKQSFQLSSNTSHSFAGFIHNFQVTIGKLEKLSKFLKICESSTFLSCIEDCDIFSFFNNGSCSPCDLKCNSGCVRSTDCNICFDENCLKCTNFNSGSCLECFPGFLLKSGKCQGVKFGSDLMEEKEYLKGNLNERRLIDCPDPCQLVTGSCSCSGNKVFDVRFGTLFLVDSLIEDFALGSNGLSPDMNDPMYQDARGAYFTSVTYIQRNLMIANEFILSFWVKPEADGVFYSKTALFAEFQGGSFKVSLSLLSQSILIDFSITLLNWYHFVIKVFIQGTDATSMTLYNSGVIFMTSSLPDLHLINDVRSYFSVGQVTISSQVFQGFQGFLWSISMFLDLTLISDDILSCTCSITSGSCPKESKCLSLSDVHYSSNDPSLLCDTKCLTCADSSVCLICYWSLVLESGVCVCAPGYTWSTVSSQCVVLTCIPKKCYLNCFTCDSCNGCTTCNSGYFLINQACVLCPTGFLQQGLNCIFQQETVIHLLFDGSGLLDLEKNPAGSPEFYYRRGAYFSNENTFKINSGFILAPEFSFQIWFLASSTEGCLFSKQEIGTFNKILNIYLENNYLKIQARFSNGSFSIIDFLSGNFFIWNYFSLRQEFLTSENFQLSLKLNQQEQLISNQDFIIDDINQVSCFIGSSLNNLGNSEMFFTGFIYLIQILNSPSQTSSLCTDPCFECLTDGSCLSICDVDSSLIDANCQSCEESLTCLMCGDFLCELCENIFRCQKCRKNSGLVNGKCFCNDGFYLADKKCLRCQAGCLKCDENECFECKAGYFLEISCVQCSSSCVKCNENSCLTCVEGFYIENGLCYEKCDSLCKVCSFGKCLECFENSNLDLNQCLCSDGFFLYEKKCLECENGCKKCDEEKCFKCFESFYLDEICIECSFSCLECNETDCLTCSKGFHIEDGSCFEQCDPLCNVCSRGVCLECKENSVLDMKKCFCIEGFEEVDGNQCREKEIHLNISVSSSNDLTFLFSEDLKPKLDKSCLLLSTLNESVNFKIEQKSLRRYSLFITFTKTVKIGQLLEISFICEIKSSKGSKLLILKYNATLHTLQVKNTVKLYEINENIYGTVTIVTTSSVVAASFFNPDFSSLWSFLSSIQIITFLYLLNFSVSESTKGLLLGLRKYLIFPNFIEYFFNNPGKNHGFSKLKDFKFKKNSFFNNSGQILSMFLFGLFLLILMKFLEKVLRLFSKTKLKDYFRKFYENYRYSFFIRFWIQNYLEILISAGLSILTSDLNDLNQALNFLFSCYFSFFLVFTIPLLFLLSLVYKEKIRNDESTMSLYGSLFYEFKDDNGALRSNFYTFYFFRRLSLVLSIFFLHDYPLIQVTLFEIFTLSNLFICAFRQPFNEAVLNYCNLITETLIGLTGVAFALYLPGYSQEVVEGIDFAMIVLVNFIVAVQASASFIIFAKVIRAKWRMRKNTKVQSDEEKHFQVVVKVDFDHELKDHYLNAPNVSYLSVNEDAKESLSRSHDSHHSHHSILMVDK